ncbi:MAG: translation initiation factor IF-3, partial [Bacteroidota bacterium]
MNSNQKSPAPSGPPRPPRGLKAGFKRPGVKEELHRINNRITAPKVRVVAEGINPGVYAIAQAIKMAEEMGLDLVEIAAQVDPPVCKIVDYSKFLYEQKKKAKEMKAKAAKIVIKDIRFG